MKFRWLKRLFKPVLADLSLNVLDAVCKKLGCRYEIDPDGKTVRFLDGKTVVGTYTGFSLEETLALIGKELL